MGSVIKYWMHQCEGVVVGPKPTLYHIGVQLNSVENFKTVYSTHSILHLCPIIPHHPVGLDRVLKKDLLFNDFSITRGTKFRNQITTDLEY